MRMGLTDDFSGLINSRCAYNPLRKKQLINSPSIDYTACVASLLTYYKLKDDVNDCKGLKKIKYILACALMKPSKNKAVKRFMLPENEIAELLNELTINEKSDNSALDSSADIFGRLLSITASYGVDDEMQRFVLEKCFYYIGKWIYIIDAVDDYPDDLKNGDYNPFKKDGLNIEAIDYTLQAILQQLDNYILKIKFNDGDIFEIIKNIVYMGCDSVANQVYKKSSEKLQKHSKSKEIGKE